MKIICDFHQLKSDFTKMYQDTKQTFINDINFMKASCC